MSQIRIGKTVIETLTSGMYEDARFVYREYVQNAADQIDKAVELGVLPNRNSGAIHISINNKNNSIIIEDNATGIKSEDFMPALANIALSTKDRAKNKGFRGIGRLGGLGYCNRLIFESKYKGEKVKNTMVWDANDLQNKLNNHKLDMDAASVVDSVISIDSEDSEEGKHYFKVIMEDVQNTELLDRKNIEGYLSMVAPVPFCSHFIFKNLIHKKLAEAHLSIDEYRIFINTDQLHKAYTTSLYDGSPPDNKKYDEIFDIDTLMILDAKQEIVAWGWYGISKFEKQIPSNGNIARGVRLRKGNIQIGSDNALVKLHKEQRGNFYFIGEVHAFHPELIPNSRRDYFNENKTSKLFEQKLKELFHSKFYKLYHDANKLKNAVKKIETYKELSKEYKEKSKTGSFSSKQQENDLIKGMEKAKSEAINKHRELLRFKEKAATDSTLNKIYDKVVGANIEERLVKGTHEPDGNPNNKVKYRTQKLTSLSRKEEKIIRKIFEIIDLMLPDLKERGEELKNKIEEEFK